MVGSISPVFSPQHWNFIQLEKASTLLRAGDILLGTLQVLSSHEIELLSKHSDTHWKIPPCI